MSGELCGKERTTPCSVETCDFTSHHSRVFVQTVIHRDKPCRTYRTCRNWRTADMSGLISDVRFTDWGEVVGRRADTCELQWQRFRAEFNRIIYLHAPVRRIRVHNPSPPPVVDDTLELMALRREARKNGTRETYRRLNIAVKRAVRKDQRDIIAQRVNETTPSQLYRKLRPVITSKRGTPTKPVDLTADELNAYFTSIGSETRDKVMSDFTLSGREPLSVRLPRVNTGRLNIIPVTLDQLRHALFSLPNRTPCDDEDLPIFILKLTFDVIGRSLFKIVNNSIVSETVPSSWKSAVVFPLHKRDDPSEPSNLYPLRLCQPSVKLSKGLLTSKSRHT